jgi:hypothetical protein
VATSTNSQLISVIHDAGINCRYMGVLRSRVRLVFGSYRSCLGMVSLLRRVLCHAWPWRCQQVTLAWPRECLLGEMTARTLRRYFASTDSGTLSALVLPAAGQRPRATAMPSVCVRVCAASMAATSAASRLELRYDTAPQHSVLVTVSNVACLTAAVPASCNCSCANS